MCGAKLVKMIYKTLLFVSAIFGCCNCARILAVMPTPSYSHQVTFQPLWKELSLRGHQVTLLTTDVIKESNLINLTQIDLSFSYERWNKDIVKVTKSNSLFAMIDASMMYIEDQLSYPPVQDLIKNESEHFDVAMIEFAMPAVLAFRERFKCPTILVTSMDTFTFMNYQMGNPVHPIVYPDSLLGLEDELKLIDRLHIIGYHIFMVTLSALYTIPHQQNLIHTYFGSNYSSINDMMMNISLVLTNSDPIFHKVKPTLPNIVQIGGGIYRPTPDPLPEKIQKTLDSATQGFIYFSLGSNAKSKDLSKETQKVILDTFAELPYVILWKFEEEGIIEKSENVITSKWLPQLNVLKHPHIKLFITQGGLQSMDEAIYSHVPMLGMPVFADQQFNIKKMVKKGFGLYIDYKKLTKEEFKEKILEVIGNSRYKNKVKELADLAQDQQINSLEKAVWWTEYVIRHKGAYHLRSPMLDIPIYQYLLLDVIAVLLIVVALSLGILSFVIKCIITKFCKKRKLKVN
ncbi:hypothetical protein FQA39_LY15726 [Lamprigera yunnana]|nr:hypothetical protein FQA39_LY15726 [Lamprigera yunnana]